MLIKRPPDIKPSEITPERHFVNRRNFIRTSSLAGAGLLVGTACSDDRSQAAQALPGSADETELVPNPLSDITSYNNFYEFGLDKGDPAKYSKDFKPKPWSVTIDGEADVTGTFDYDDIVGPHTIEERIYRLRCVEAWSMIVPWNGIPLGDLLKRFKPNSRAKYVAFQTVVRPAEMPGQRRGVLDFPYVEGLTIEEAMHPLTLMVTGVYGIDLPNQNGAPL
ncbi:MAG: protein-methionine-sulfoxide reductase catalytic subunit MsrP, partial [Gammaproteobacteria bacterium]|nr:protein-methionine-sulfoxide reductase catalytic subunit MsrP [Gammaproteobacteria bacterium]